jgi:uncharacterized protein (DUF1501 family)
MLSILGRKVRLCDGITRREVLRVGGLAFTGLMWPRLLQARASAASQGRPHGKAKACILIFNYGGPSHLDMWDLKPDAPKEIRGEFKPIATRVPGISITEHLPRLARLADRYALLRSVTHRDNDHAIGTYLALTGHSHPKNAILGIEPPETPQDLPSMGSVLSKVRPATKPVFSYITLGDLRHFGNHDSLGQNAGCLGKLYNAFTVPFVRPLDGSLDIHGATSVMTAVDTSKLAGRRQLLDQLDRAAPVLEATAGMRNLDGFTRQAYELLASPANRDAFDLAREPQKVREFYGPTAFAQNCLLARRLVEAGVPMITVYSVGNRDWDTHSTNFRSLKETLLPPMDQGVTSLLEDLDGRGLLKDTLVVWMGDMGRTPRINGGAGRDHWSFCYSILMAGGGVRPGQVFGSSDRMAAYPSTNPVGPGDVAATIYHCLGIDPHTTLTDQQGRPIVACTGKPIHAVLG